MSLFQLDTIRNFLRNFGKLHYYARATWITTDAAHTLAQYFPCFSFIRAICRAFQTGTHLDGLVTAPTHVFSQLHKLRSLLLSQKPGIVISQQRTSTNYIITDSSDTGYGFIIIKEGISQRLASWALQDSRKHINVKELQVLCFAAPLMAQKNFHWICDNQAAIGAFKNTYSQSPALNNVLCRIHRLSCKFHFGISDTSYIDTKQNVADTLSRGSYISNASIVTFLDSLQHQSSSGVENRLSSSICHDNLEVPPS